MLPADLLNFELPEKPGHDAITKALLQEQVAIGAITTSLYDIPPRTYMSAGTAFVDGTACDALYTPISADLSSLPPVVVEVQHSVNLDFMRRSSHYCHMVYKPFKVDPVLLVFCINSPTNEIRVHGSPHAKLRYCFSVPSFSVALECVFLSRRSIEDTVNNIATPLPPLAALAHFILSGQRCIEQLERCDDKTIQDLYRICKDLAHNETNDSDMAPLAVIGATSAIEDLLLKTITAIDEEKFSKASQLATNALDVCRGAKRHAQEAFQSETDGKMDDSDKENAKYDNEDVNIPRTRRQIAHDRRLTMVKHVHEYKLSNQGRMDWNHCFAVLKKKGLIEGYNTTESLKNTYNNIMKKM